MSGFTSRPAWASAPAEIRRAVEYRVGVPVAVHDVHGGMSPGPAAVLVLSGGDRVFVKAVSGAVNAGSYRLYQQEAAILAVMPAGLPTTRLRAVVETGDWIALVMDVAAGKAAGPPWTTSSVAAVARACAVLAAVEAPGGLPPVVDGLPNLDGWAEVAAGPRALSDWEHRHIDRLVAATIGWRHWTAGPRLGHLDVRCDNAVVDPVTGRAVLVDWGYGCRAAAWLDRALLAADVVAAGHAEGPGPARRQALDLLADQPAEAARFVIAMAGMWRNNSTLPAHPGMPTHREWQRARATALQPLLASLLAGESRTGRPG